MAVADDLAGCPTEDSCRDAKDKDYHKRSSWSPGPHRPIDGMKDSLRSRKRLSPMHASKHRAYSICFLQSCPSHMQLKGIFWDEEWRYGGATVKSFLPVLSAATVEVQTSQACCFCSSNVLSSSAMPWYNLSSSLIKTKFLLSCEDTVQKKNEVRFESPSDCQRYSLV